MRIIVLAMMAAMAATGVWGNNALKASRSLNASSASKGSKGFKAANALNVPKAPGRVPETLDGVRPIAEAARAANHIALVNVDHAIPDDIWPLVATYAASRVQLNIWTNSLEKSIVGALVVDPRATLRRALGDKACVGVFVERNANGASFMQSPGAWSMVNVRGLDRDSPDRRTLADRYAKMILKGLAFAAGGGASLDSACSLYYNSFTLEGMDRTGVQISPMSYFPMIEILRAVGGNEIVTPVE